MTFTATLIYMFLHDKGISLQFIQYILRSIFGGASFVKRSVRRTKTIARPSIPTLSVIIPPSINLGFTRWNASHRTTGGFNGTVHEFKILQ